MDQGLGRGGEGIYQVKPLFILPHHREDFLDLLQTTQVAADPFYLCFGSALLLNCSDGIVTLLGPAIDHDHASAGQCECAGYFISARELLILIHE